MGTNMKLIEKKTIQRRFTIQDICNWMKEAGYHVPGFTRFYVDDCDSHGRCYLSPYDTLVLEFDTEDEVQEAVPTPFRHNNYDSGCHDDML